MTSLTDKFQSGRFSIGVIYLDNHLLVVEKPVNMPVQGDSSGDRDLLSACKDYIAEKFAKPGNVYLGLVHRLDRPVGGVVVFARTSKSAARLSAQFSAHTADKRYLAVTLGSPKGVEEMTDWLYKDEKTGMVTVVESSRPGAKQARLISAPICQRDGLTLRETELLTGRSHQIRVQHAHAGYPLWGDARYGSGKPGEQIALWAAKLTIEHPTLKSLTTFSSMPPETGAWARFTEELEGYYDK